MNLRKQIMALRLGELRDSENAMYSPKEIRQQAADLAEARERELLKQIEKWKTKAIEHELMAGCMDMTRQDLISAGIFGDTVPPMFVTEAVLGYIGKLKAERAARIAELRELNVVGKFDNDGCVECETLEDFINKYEVKE